MAIEIEKKYRLSLIQSRQVAAILKELDAEYKGEDFETNTLYGSGILDKKRAILRIRKIGDKTILTFKQRIKDNDAIKHQIEHETTVENGGEIEKIIEQLGFIKGLIYEKRRKTWKFHNVEIVLDQLPFGLFMEIEGSATEIKEAEMLLNAENLETEHKTYPELTVTHGVQNGEIIEARFK